MTPNGDKQYNFKMYFLLKSFGEMQESELLACSFSWTCLTLKETK